MITNLIAFCTVFFAALACLIMIMRANLDEERRDGAVSHLLDEQQDRTGGADRD